MAAQFTGEEILDLTSGRLAQGLMPDEPGFVRSDSRQLQEGDWFIALPGRHFDGHDFIGEAFSNGALGAIVAERGSYPIASTSFPLIAVDNTYDAFQQLARNWRKRLNPRVIAVTASPSEPSNVANLCARVLRNKAEILLHEEASVESLLRAEVDLEETTKVFIAKVAPLELGQTELIGRALVPTVVILTEDGFTHLRAANEEAIARAECDLLAHMEKNRGIGIVSRRSQDLLLRIKYHFPERTVLYDETVARQWGDELLKKGSAGGFDLQSPQQLADIWCAVTALRQVGLSDKEIEDALA